MAAFRAFLDACPADERWELIAGIAVQSAAPRIAHQRIASNFERHLNAALRRLRPEWRADREVGIEVSDASRYRPEPEVAVIDSVTDTERTFADRFYHAHPHNRFIVIADQDRLAVTLHARGEAGSWASTTLTAPDDALVLGELGTICKMADIYADTHLDPRRWP